MILFPAYAGVIPSKGASVKILNTFPRIRGGDPYRNICEELCEGDLENQNCLHFNDYEEAKKIVSKAEIELNYLV